MGRIPARILKFSASSLIYCWIYRHQFTEIFMPMQISIPPMPLVSSGKEGDSIKIIDQGAALMSLTVFLMALGSAVLHAVWNTLARSRPDSESYFWLGCSCLFNLATLRLTMMAYRLLPLSLAYPISRAAAPLIVTFIQIIVLGQEHGGVGIVLGIAVISFAIMLLAASARTEDKLDPRGLMFTLAAGVFTAIVVVVELVLKLHFLSGFMIRKRTLKLTKSQCLAETFIL